MKYLFMMGPSGSGKTTLAKKLEHYKSDKYKWLTQTTTRKPRYNEVEGREYFFLTEEEYTKMDNMGALIARVKKEFPPYKYGTPIQDLDDVKTNIIVVSIEGFLDALELVEEHDELNVLFIKDVEPEVERETRNFAFEEKYNKIVLEKVINIFQGHFKIVEIAHSRLKHIRNNKSLLLEFMKENNL